MIRQLDDCSKPIPSRASKGKISAFAENVARRLSFGVGAPIEPLVAMLGGDIQYKNPVSYIDRIPESIIVRSQSSFTIYLPTLTSVGRDRFTIAHELGHYFIHYPLASRQQPGLPMVATRWVDDNDADQQRAEWEANWFAAGFVMPSVEFRRDFMDMGAIQTAARFRVSVSAAEIRAKSLGL